jgi:3-isopropylmalate/(R)-2-methylmalate dehydratase small subunit
MSGVTHIRSRTVVLPESDIDTDQIFPARFLTTIEGGGFGRALFADWRFDRNGDPRPGFALNRPEAAGAEILVAGRNFGGGSSREHAAWALRDFGIRAVISSSIADIFFSNALKNGLLPVRIDEASHEWLLARPGAGIEIDIGAGVVILPDGQRPGFAIDPFARHCLMHGVDELGYLVARLPEIEAWERACDGGGRPRGAA